MDDGYDLQMKLLMLGDTGVGKTCLLLRYAFDSFSPTFITTIGIDFKIKEAELRAELPAYIRSLSGNGYAMRAFYFEIVECARLLLLLLAQLPSLLMLGSTG